MKAKPLITVLIILLLTGLAWAITIDEDIGFRIGYTTYYVDGGLNCGTLDLTGNRFNDICNNINLSIIPSTNNNLDITILSASTSLLNLTATPSYIYYANFGLTGFAPSTNVECYQNYVLEDTKTSNGDGYILFNSQDFNSEINFYFTTDIATTTTTSSTTTSTGPTTSTSSTTSTTLAAAYMTPCMTHLSQTDIKEAIKCVYIGENFRRSDGAPTMGYWFYGIIIFGFTFMLYLKVKNIAIAGITLLIFMAVFNGQFPPQAQTTYWGIVVFSILTILYGIFKSD